MFDPPLSTGKEGWLVWLRDRLGRVNLAVGAFADQAAFGFLEIVPTPCVGMPPRTLCVRLLGDAERP